jgi:tRNA modification GTPase
VTRANNPANVAILLTPPGAAAIAVIRLRGPDTSSFLEQCFSKPAKPGKTVHGQLRDGETVLDDPVVLLGETGEFADISLHGGAWIIRSTLDLAAKHGFTVIESTLPLPVTALDDTDSIFDQEVQAHLPLTRTELGLRTLLAQPEIWREALRGKIDAAEILADHSLWWLLNPPQVAIIGEPNVGKSTLANQLFGQKRSITADVPGTTRDWVGDMANIDGLPIHLIDTPGQRETPDAIERAAIAASGEKISQSDLTILVLDATRKPENIGKAGLIVINKIDQSPGWDFSKVDAIRISAKTGQGIDILSRTICEFFDIGRRGADWPRWWTDRQKEHLRRMSVGEIQNPDFGLSD